MFSKATRRRSCAALMAAVGATAGLVATGAAASAGGKVTLVFTSQYNGTNATDNWITAAAKVFEKSHPNVTVAIRNIVTNSESTYYAKLDLAERSSSTHARYFLRGLVPGPVGRRRRVHTRPTAIDVRPGMEKPVLRVPQHD